MHFLDRFIKGICLLPYLYESEEFQLFMRPPEGSSSEKALGLLPKLTTDDLLKRFRIVMPVNEMAGEHKLKYYNDSVNDFVKDCKEYLEHLKNFKKEIKVIVPLKNQELAYYKNFVDFIVKYEELNLRKPSGDQPITFMSGEHG